ncbi:MAG: peptidase, partial [Thermoanaerobaculia bacterium]
MKKLLAAFAALVPLACNTPMPQQMEPVATTPQGHLAVKQDVPQRLAKMPETVIDYDRSLLNDNERRVVEKLIEASKFIDEIFWLQVDESNPEYRTRLARQANDSPLDRAAYEYFLANRGRFDRIDEDEPFIEPFDQHKPAGAAFYPPDMTKEEFERYLAAHPEQKDELQGLFTVIRR